jgi:hypothetical protein
MFDTFEGNMEGCFIILANLYLDLGTAGGYGGTGEHIFRNECHL